MTVSAETHFLGKVAVKAIIENDQGQILLVRSAGSSLRWELPGGRMNEQETIESALHRELYEELGVEISDFKLFFSYQKVIVSVPTFFIVCLTKLKNQNQKFSLQKSEIAEATWVGIDEFSNYQMFDDYSAVLNAYKEHRHINR